MKTRKKLKKVRKNDSKGITLIALVITIIVLLILAAVSIATLTGENGILTRANEAKTETEEAEETELRRLTALEAATNLDDTIYTDNSTGEEKTVTIPAETAVSQIEGENTLKDGLVIIDKNGNEWVWIEVPESVTASGTTDEELKNALISYATNYKGNYSDTWYEGYGLEEPEYADKYSEMLQSIKANNGFFIGRYEVGSFNNPVTANDTARKAVIQKETYPYNWVTCSQAEELSETLVPDKGMTSSLMFGIQWDLVMKYLETKGVSKSELKTNSGSWGNYRDVEFTVEEGNKYAISSNWSLRKWNDVPVNYPKPTFDTDGNGVLLSTGATERNSRMNIYDLAGNVWEWTLEKSTNTGLPSVRRGGDCSYSGSDFTAFRRGIISASVSDDTIGFRPALY